MCLAPSSCGDRKLINSTRIVKRNLSSALIMEDDADWDIRIRDQLQDFATATHALTQPLAGSFTYADSTYPEPKDDTIPVFDFHQLPSVVSPTTSPYGDHWDLLWLGHCGMNFPSKDKSPDLPRGRVVWKDNTVPQRHYLWNLWSPDELKEQYPDHTRVVHHAQEPVCSLVYAVTQKAARQILYQLALKDFNAGYDILLRWFCEGREGRNDRRSGCMTMQPSLFQHHRPTGPRTHESDISPHGDGTEWRTEPHTNVLRWSVRMNAEELINGGTHFKDQWPDQ